MNEETLVPLIDTDGLRFRCGFAADGQMKREAKLHEPDASPERIMEMIMEVDYLNIALHNTKTVLEAIQEKFRAPHKAYIHKQGNFRYDVATILPYKGNRDKTHKPKYFNEISEYIVKHWGAIEVEGIESDDAMGIEQSLAPWATTVICSNDKDMLQIAGWHYNWVKEELVHVTPEEADLMFYWQMLVGDTADNIPGIKGIGEKRATAIVVDCGQDIAKVKAEVQRLYQKQYGMDWERPYNEVGTLLYIHRDHDDLQKGCPLL
jgi:5'-3' exonuclease